MRRGATISVEESRADVDAVVRGVEAGETFVVTRDGVAAAELGRLRNPAAVLLREALASARSLPRIDADRLRADVDEVLDQALPE